MFVVALFSTAHYGFRLASLSISLLWIAYMSSVVTARMQNASFGAMALRKLRMPPAATPNNTGCNTQQCRLQHQQKCHSRIRCAAPPSRCAECASTGAHVVQLWSQPDRRWRALLLSAASNHGTREYLPTVVPWYPGVPTHCEYLPLSLAHSFGVLLWQPQRNRIGL